MALIPGGGMAKGMWVTRKNFWTPKVTLQYPEERPQMPERWRGRLEGRRPTRLLLPRPPTSWELRSRQVRSI